MEKTLSLSIGSSSRTMHCKAASYKCYSTNFNPQPYHVRAAKNYEDGGRLSHNRVGSSETMLAIICTGQIEQNTGRTTTPKSLHSATKCASK